MCTQINTQIHTHTYTLVHTQTRPSVCPSVCPQRSFYGLANRVRVLTASLPCAICLSNVANNYPLSPALLRSAAGNRLHLLSRPAHHRGQSPAMKNSLSRSIVGFFFRAPDSDVREAKLLNATWRFSLGLPCAKWWFADFSTMLTFSKSNVNLMLTTLKNTVNSFEETLNFCGKNPTSSLCKDWTRPENVVCQPPPNYVGDEWSSHFCPTVNNWDGKN